MKSIILNIRKEEDLYEKYSDEISSELIRYLIEEAKVKEDIEIIVNTKLKIDNIDILIKEGLKNLYKDYKLIDKFYDNRKIIFFIIGMMFLIFSTITKPEVIKELILIIGWVALWEVMDISINIDSKYNSNKKIIKKLYNCKIKVK